MQPVFEGLHGGTGGNATAVIGAAHAVLSGRRQATRVDLLVSTLIEVLAPGARSPQTLIAEVQRAWPAAEITESDVLDALIIGMRSDAQLFLKTEGLEGIVWRLDDAGLAEAETSREWRGEMRRRAVADVRARSQADFRECSEAEATVWVDQLTVALAAGIVSAEVAFLGDIEASADHVRPRSVDRAAIMHHFSRNESPAVGEFLSAAALAALDPSDPFGNELVSALATTYVLHGHLARLDLAEHQRRLGPLAGQEIVLDTPILLALVSGAECREPLEQMLRSSGAAGVEVIALEHYLDELDGLLESRESLALAEESVISDPEQRAAYIALADGDEIVSAYARLRAEDIVADWSQFRGHVRGLRGRLLAQGVTVRPHGNSNMSQVAECRAALETALAQEGRHRSPQVLERDAHTLAFAMRHRRKVARHVDGVWPGVFVLTTDRRLSPAYARVDPGNAAFPVAVRPSAFTMLLARVRPVPELARLVEAASRMLTREVADRVAVRYPPAVAAELAGDLAGAGGGTDIRMAQLESVTQVMENAEAGDVAAEVLRHRIRRVRESARYAASMGTAERAAADDRVLRAERFSAQMEGRRQEVQAQLDQEHDENEGLRQQLGDHYTPQEARRLARRASIRMLAAAANLFIVAWCVLRGVVVLASVMGLLGLLLWLQTSAWARDPRVQLRTAMVAIVADTVGLLTVAADWIKDLVG